ncbi:flavin reductase family protein [Dactylosporangium sp. CA-139114]|uniref:flavin reductase family protein n=1 Tax=Dactylosporangium sp. CA-139114 TaxID=3239931 RepID=UPI003D967F60
MTAPALLSPTDLRRVFGAFPTGVTAIAAVVDGIPVGLAASSFTSVSLDPPLASVCIARTSTTWPVLRRASRLGVSVLAADQERLGRQLSQRGGDRFAGATWRSSRDGEILLDGACAWLDCSIHEEYPAGDHDIVLLRIHDLDADHAAAPLVFHRSGFNRLRSSEAGTRT